MDSSLKINSACIDPAAPLGSTATNTISDRMQNVLSLEVYTNNSLLKNRKVVNPDYVESYFKRIVLSLKDKKNNYEDALEVFSTLQDNYLQAVLRKRFIGDNCILSFVIQQNHPLLKDVVGVYEQFPELLKEILTVRFHGNTSSILSIAISGVEEENLRIIQSLYINNKDCLRAALECKDGCSLLSSAAGLLIKLELVPALRMYEAIEDNTILQEALKCLEKEQFLALMTFINDERPGISDSFLELILVEQRNRLLRKN